VLPKLKLPAVFVLALILGLACGSRSWAGSALPFPRPASLEPNVSFWVDVFTVYSARDFVIHDREQVYKTYQVFHLPGSGSPTREEIDWVNAYARAKYGAMLTRLASGRQPETSEERKVAALFKGEPLSAYTEAAANIRVQQGLRENFKEGLLRSRYYTPTMERIFRSFGLPPELVTLANVESGFYGRAHSGAGAVGIWQFTRATARHYMRVSRRQDDRLNPTRSTQAAAKLLRDNYELLGDWPLAITAYNYGSSGMAHAAAAYDNDYERVFESYKGPRFGFAARNYYAEFLAALQVHRYEDKYFPGIEDEEAPRPADTRTTHLHRVKRAAVRQRASSPSHASHPAIKSARV
jgi:peptidoglycan lytic transglycosylase D